MCVCATKASFVCDTRPVAASTEEAHCFRRGLYWRQPAAREVHTQGTFKVVAGVQARPAISRRRAATNPNAAHSVTAASLLALTYGLTLPAAAGKASKRIRLMIRVSDLNDAIGCALFYWSRLRSWLSMTLPVPTDDFGRSCHDQRNAPTERVLVWPVFFVTPGHSQQQSRGGKKSIAITLSRLSHHAAEKVVRSIPMSPDAPPLCCTSMPMTVGPSCARKSQPAQDERFR